MKYKRYQIVNWKFINISVNNYDCEKIIQYFLFTSLSILAGFFYNREASINFDTTMVLLLFPTLYVFNYTFHTISRFIFKYFISRITLIHEKNRYNIFNSHSIFIHLFLVYLIFGNYLRIFEKQCSLNAILPLLMVYSLLFSLHRCLRHIENCTISNDTKPLISILKYKSFDHAHIFAGTCIGLPFIIGLLLQDNNLSNTDHFYDSLIAYVVFLISWIILYQHKYKSSHFLDTYRFILPCSLYPIFPILFFIFYNNSVVYFYIIYLLMILLYLFPILNLFISLKMEKLFNEKLILLLILCVIPLSQFIDLSSVSSKYKIDILSNNIPKIPVLLATIAMLVATRNDDKDSQYIRFYCIMPYFVLNLFMVVLLFWGDHFLDQSSVIYYNITQIASHIFVILGVYAIGFIGVSLFVCYPKFYQDIFNKNK